MNQQQKEVLEQSLNDEEKMLKWLKSVYEQAAKDVEKKITELSMRKDMENLQSIIYQKKYQEALQEQINEVLADLNSSAYKGVSEFLNSCYENGYIGAMYDIALQGIPVISPIDPKQVVQALENDSKLSQGLYDRLGEDVDKLKKSVKAEVSRGIVNGSNWNEVAEKIAKGMNSPFNTAKNNAMRIARTEGHRVQCQGQMDACDKAKSKGADVVKQWDSTLDGKTRDSHRMVDGQIRELDAKFSNGLRFPGDPHGIAGEVVNCRCALLQRAKWALDDEFDKMNNFTKELESFDSPASYEEFKKGFWSDENIEYMKYVDKMESKYKTKNFEKLLDAMTDREYNHFKELSKQNPVLNKPKKTSEPKVAEPEKPKTSGIQNRWDEYQDKIKEKEDIDAQMSEARKELVASRSQGLSEEDRDEIKRRIDDLKAKSDSIKTEIESMKDSLYNDPDIYSVFESDVRKTLEKKGFVDYNEVKKMSVVPSEESIIKKISGGDLTEGSCSSLALTYAGNKNGFDVTDYRDGESRHFFSQKGNIKQIAELPQVKSTMSLGKNDFKTAKEVLSHVEEGKEYYLATGKHAAVVRKKNGVFEYLELQSGVESDNGWTSFDEYGSMQKTLKERFGCRTTHTVGGTSYAVESILIDIDSFNQTEEFRKILGYINTDADKQRKGVKGRVK